jgi:hypothetical protein
MNNMLMALAVLAVFLAPLAAGQNEGSIAIAEAVAKTSIDAVGDFTDCVEKLVGAGVPQKEAIKACKEMAKIASKQIRGGLSEASGAAKASRPVVVASYGGWSRGYYSSRSWDCGATVVVSSSRGWRGSGGRERGWGRVRGGGRRP